jgi:Fur family transcriptional regulator, ferric uptake regulator
VDDRNPELHGATEILRAYGLRVTPQRQLLVAVARAMPGHFSADDAHERIQRAYPGVSKVSVYRGLETLRELGLVTCTELGLNAVQYEWVQPARHHHMICTACGYEQDLPDDEMNALRERLAALYGFHASIDHHAIWGLCGECFSHAHG